MFYLICWNEWKRMNEWETYTKAETTEQRQQQQQNHNKLVW